jgi:N-carbamoyl-L-amino-acid hydrolase
MSLDIRDLSNQRIDDLIEQLQGEMEAIATDTHTTIEMQPRLRNEPL